MNYFPVFFKLPFQKFYKRSELLAQGLGRTGVSPCPTLQCLVLALALIEIQLPAGMHPEGQQMMAQMLRFLPPVWETQPGFSADCGLNCPQLLQVFRSEQAERTLFSLSLTNKINIHICVCYKANIYTDKYEYIHTCVIFYSIICNKYVYKLHGYIKCTFCLSCGESEGNREICI